jgi:hypothetical protein
LNETVQTLRYCTIRPLDQFAKHFLGFLDDWFYINDNIETGAGKYLNRVKVFDTSDRFWAWLLETRETRMAEGSPGEYSSPQPRQNIDGMSIPPVAKHRTTGQLYFIPVEAREAWHRNTYPARLAHEFANYDALIFLHKTDRWARALTREKMDTTASEEDFQAAKRHVIEEAPFKATAHECLHLLQKITGGEMPEWDPAGDADPVEPLFDQFIDQLTLPIFEHLYVKCPGPQVDKIDL